MEEKEDLGSIGIAFCEGEEVEIVVSYVEILWTLQCSISDTPAEVNPFRL